jgi:hypothetical protein
MTNIFVCNLVVVIKVCQSDIYMMYCDQTFKFLTYNFWAFKSLSEFKHENIQMQWVLDLNSRIQHLALEANGQHIWAMHWNLEISFQSYRTKDVFVVVKSLVKTNAKVIKLFHFVFYFYIFLKNFYLLFSWVCNSMMCVWFDKGCKKFDKKIGTYVSSPWCHGYSWIIYPQY